MRCYNLLTTELPLESFAIADIFKFYMCDTGLFIAMLEDGTQFDVLNGNLYSCKGAVFEELIASCTLVEVKASTGNTKSAKTILKHPEKYHVEKVTKLGDYNIGRDGPILTLPHYMAFLLNSV